MLLDEAVARGAMLIYGQAAKPLLSDDGSARGVQVRMPHDRTMEIESEVLLDHRNVPNPFAELQLLRRGYRSMDMFWKKLAVFAAFIHFRSHGRCWIYSLAASKSDNRGASSWPCAGCSSANDLTKGR
jgi:hypothetical protein